MLECAASCFFSRLFVLNLLSFSHRLPPNTLSESCFSNQTTPSWTEVQLHFSCQLQLTFFFSKGGPILSGRNWYGNVQNWKQRHMAICHCNALFCCSLGPSPCVHESSRSNWNGRAYLCKTLYWFHQREQWTCLPQFALMPAIIFSR